MTTTTTPADQALIARAKRAYVDLCVDLDAVGLPVDLERSSVLRDDSGVRVRLVDAGRLQTVVMLRLTRWGFVPTTAA